MNKEQIKELAELMRSGDPDEKIDQLFNVDEVKIDNIIASLSSVIYEAPEELDADYVIYLHPLIFIAHSFMIAGNDPGVKLWRRLVSNHNKNIMLAANLFQDAFES